MLIGCPVWDDMNVSSTADALEIGALGITIPTIDRGDGGDFPDRALRLTDEVKLTSSDGITPLACQLSLENQVVFESARQLKHPWIRKGPDCPEGVHVVEGLCNLRMR